MEASRPRRLSPLHVDDGHPLRVDYDPSTCEPNVDTEVFLPREMGAVSMKIAVIAWGSMVWDPQSLQAAGFAPNGPLLPIEFCRVSADGRLTLVIDETFGAVCTTHSASSALDDLDAAIENLRARERTTTARIGFVDLGSGKRSDFAAETHPEALATITAWAQSNGYDAAIWTALASNFDEPDKGGEPFSVTAAIRYLERVKGRDTAQFDLALDYIRRAPSQVDTPVREDVFRRWPAPAA
jgi:hypothetical protein